MSLYASTFGLSQSPFSIAPDPRYLFMSALHREALAHLLYGLGGGGGVVLLTGEVGAGKTTVCRCFLEQVPETCRVAYIFNPRLSVVELLQSIAQEFGLPTVAEASSIKAHIDALNAFLLQSHALGRQCVLVIDEAQNLSADVLEQLRLLTNLETAERKLLQIILVGQPELREQLARPDLAQLAQRVIARYHLGALGPADTQAYVAHRLGVAGHQGALPFEAAALGRLHRLTGGVPRRINLLCDRALLGAYAEGRAKVSTAVLARAAAEVFGAGRGAQTGRPRWPAWAGGALVGAALVGVGLGVGQQWPAVSRSAPTARSVDVPAGTASAGGLAAGATPSASVSAVGPASLAAAAAAPASASVPSLTASPASAAVAGVGPAQAASRAAATPPAASVPARASTVAGDAASAVQLEAMPALRLLAADEQSAWRTLAPAWGLSVDAAPLCGAASPWQCFRTSQASLALLRALQRPGVLVLRPADGPPRWAVLAGLDERSITLAAGRQRWQLPVEALAGLWRGEFITLWRPPPGYRQPLGTGASGPAVDALAQGLARVRQQPPPVDGAALQGPLATALAGFQLAQGLRADGVAGPTTFMQLNRRLGTVAEPALPWAP